MILLLPTANITILSMQFCTLCIPGLKKMFALVEAILSY